VRIKNYGDRKGFRSLASINAQKLTAYSLNNLNSYSGLNLTQKNIIELWKKKAISEKNIDLF